MWRALSLIPGTMVGVGGDAFQGKDLYLHYLWEHSQAAMSATSSWKDILFSFWHLLLLTTFTRLNVKCRENKCSCIRCLTRLSDSMATYIRNRYKLSVSAVVILFLYYSDFKLNFLKIISVNKILLSLVFSLLVRMNELLWVISNPYCLVRRES